MHFELKWDNWDENKVPKRVSDDWCFLAVWLIKNKSA